MDQAFIPALVALTSAAAYWLGSRRLGLQRSDLPAAALRAVECLGAMLAFLVANLGLSVVVILGMRALSGRFVSLYLVADRSVVFLSLLQALVFEWWRSAPPKD